jgi:hypothetical protein
MRILSGIVVVVLLAAVVGCGQHADQTARAPLTERQRDSVIAKSSLPGAAVVGRALDVSDRAAERASKMNAADSLFH